MRRSWPATVAFALLAPMAVVTPVVHADGVKTPPVFRVENQDRRLSVEVLDDDLFQFEFRADGKTRDGEIPTSPMVFKTDYAGAKSLKRNGNLIETPQLGVDCDAVTGAVRLRIDVAGQVVEVAKLTPSISGSSSKDVSTTQPALAARAGLSIDAKRLRLAYGLGEQLLQDDGAALSWRFRRRTPGNNFGNHLVEFRGGAVGNAQFPILYAISEYGPAFAIFVDASEALSWDLTGKAWDMSGRGEVLRWYVIVGPDLSDVRRNFVELVGRPPVPPRAAFGLWVSEYGYDNWGELEDKLKTLRAAKFPIDGMVLDLQWFGGIGKDGVGSRMGAIDWDRKAFPDPAKKIAELRERHGIGLIPIEEPYVATGLADFAELEKKGVLVRSKENGPAAVMKSWWGTGGMVDFTSESAGDEWHDRRRKPLIDAGIAGHWTDLGEPENYPDAAWYHGFGAGHDEAANHNMYNFAWAASIARGYERQQSTRRPFILTRSGTAGVQRFGAAMWSGDIGSNMPSQRAHFRAQAHMSLSGVDYFGSDIGGFHRQSLDGDLNDLYTRWFANSCLIDVPVRPHTSNTDNTKQTAPDRIGDVASNLANIRRRYELIPYLYSLAHEARRVGEPVFPPMVYHYESDATARTLTDHKMIGLSLLAAMITDYKIDKRDVYLPEGVWYDYESDARFESQGEWVKDVPIVRNGKVMAPLFAHEGAIIPLASVDDKTMNASGKRLDGTRDVTMRLRVYPSEAGSPFYLYEDDGETIAYKSGGVRMTTIHQKMTKNEITIDLDAASGEYAGSVKARPWVLTQVIPYGIDVVRAEVDGQAVEVVSTGPRIGRHPKPGRRWTIRTPQLDTAKAHRVTLTLRGNP